MNERSKQHSRSHTFLGMALILLLTSATQLAAAPIISEFLAADKNRHADEEGEYPGWIEILNPDSTAIHKLREAALTAVFR